MDAGDHVLAVMVKVLDFWPTVGNGMRGLTRVLGDRHSRCNQEPLMVKDKDGRPQEDLLVVHCFCLCRDGPL